MLRARLGLALVLLAGCPRPEGATRPVAGAGDVLQSFLVRDAASGDYYCMVCRFAGRPTVVAVFDLEDPALDADLAALERLRADHPRLTLFAVLGRFEGGALRPADDEAAALASARARRDRLGLGFPLALLPRDPPADKAAGYRPYAAGYALSKSRTVLYATADNRVRYAATLGTDGADAASLARAVAAPKPE